MVTFIFIALKGHIEEINNYKVYHEYVFLLLTVIICTIHVSRKCC